MPLTMAIQGKFDIHMQHNAQRKTLLAILLLPLQFSENVIPFLADWSWQFS